MRQDASCAMDSIGLKTVRSLTMPTSCDNITSGTVKMSAETKLPENATFQANSNGQQGARVNYLNADDYDDATDDSLEDDDHHFQSGRY